MFTFLRNNVPSLRLVLVHPLINLYVSVFVFLAIISCSYYEPFCSLVTEVQTGTGLAFFLLFAMTKYPFPAAKLLDGKQRGHYLSVPHFFSAAHVEKQPRHGTSSLSGSLNDTMMLPSSLVSSTCRGRLCS